MMAVPDAALELALGEIYGVLARDPWIAFLCMIMLFVLACVAAFAVEAEV